MSKEFSKNGKYIIENKNEDIDSIRLKFICNEDNFVLEPPLLQNFCSKGKWYYRKFPECLPICNYNNWNNSWTECVPDCGVSNQPDSYLLANNLQLGDFPYHVGIYIKLKSKNKNELKYICGGSIISLRLVVTEPYCVRRIDGSFISLDVHDVFVAAGKFYNDYESSLDTNAQKRQIIGWGHREHKYSALNSRLVTAIGKKFITLKKICGSSNSDQGCDICVGDIGSAWVVAKNNKGVTRFYIQHMVSGRGFGARICGETSIDRYDEFYNDRAFLKQILVEYPNIIRINATSASMMSTNCKVPFISNGRLLISGKPYSSTKPVPSYSRIYIECNAGTYLYPPSSDYITCQNGKFNAEIPKCSRKCPPLESKTVDFQCELNRVATNCSSSSFEGTIVTMLCITGTLNMFSDDQYGAAFCTNGVWDQPFLTCQSACAYHLSQSTVSIYENISNSDDPMGKYICAGSIISHNIILSAAQCFTNETTGELLNLGSFFIYPDSSPSFTRKVVDVKIPHEYKGKLSNFTGNLGLVKLDKPLVFDIFDVRGACFNKNATFERGFVYGRAYRPEYQKVMYKYFIPSTYNLTECINDVTNNVETGDKFCVGLKNDLSDLKMCITSQGAGYFAKGHDTNLYLDGVTSLDRLNKTCNIEGGEKYLFTEVKNYRTFIDSGVEEFWLCKIPTIQNCSFTVAKRIYKINDAIPNFSIVQVKCDKYFQIFPPFHDSLLCTDGTYDKKIPSCIHCGQIMQSNEQDNSTNGVIASEIPWLVKIYNNKTFKCAGSLINSQIIITNSLCFPDTAGDYRIIVGRPNIDYLNFNQRRIVNKQDIKIKDDIALIILNNPVNFNLSEKVHPICLDWKDEFGYQEMNSSAPGIGLASNINDSDIKENENWQIQTFSDVDSSEKFLLEYEKSTLPNYFSAKSVKGPNTCLQVIGSGIAIENMDGAYFLRGVMTSITNKTLTFCTFIKISYYLPFIINIVESI